MGIILNSQFVLSDEGKQALRQIAPGQDEPLSEADLEDMAQDWDMLNELSDTFIQNGSVNSDPERTFVVSFLTDTYQFFRIIDNQKSSGAARQLGALYYTGALNEGLALALYEKAFAAMRQQDEMREMLRD
ncbi:MAG: hypothetical protein ACOYJL_09845 [Tractidigestivibacter sp.]|uniref:hypothetical protein n=1 Tax=Tractidigestivibacter sp. TaxID=2847320 RepID=UPI003D8CC8B2